MSRHRYQSLTAKRKLEIIDSLSPGKWKRIIIIIASEFGIPQSTLSTILKDKDRLRALYAVGGTKRSVTENRHDLTLMLLSTNGLQPQEPNRFQSVDKFWWQKPKNFARNSICKQTGPALVDGWVDGRHVTILHTKELVVKMLPLTRAYVMTGKMK